MLSYKHRALICTILFSLMAAVFMIPKAVPADDTGADTRFGMYIPASSNALRQEAAMDAAVAKLLDNGFNLAVPQVRAFGEVYYASGREPLSRNVSPDLSDPLGDLIVKVKAKNSAAAVMPSLQLLTAYSYFTNLSEDASGALAANPGWVMANAQGKLEDDNRRRYLDPTVPAVQDYIVDVVKEVVRQYDVAGIIVEDLVYPAPAAEWGFSPAAILAWQMDTGQGGRPSPDQAEWLEWRAAQLTKLAGRLRDAVHETRPGARLALVVNCDGRAPVSADDFPNTAPWREHGQDWVRWAAEGTGDIIILNNLRRDSTESEASRLWMEFAAGLESLALMGMNVAGSLNFPTGVASQMNLAQRHGAGVIVLNTIDQPTRSGEDQLFRLLKSTVFNAPRAFKPSGIRFEPPVLISAPESPTTPTTGLITPVAEDMATTAPAVMETPADVTEIPEPEITPLTPEGPMPTPEAAATPAAPAPSPTVSAPSPTPEGFVLPGSPTPEPTPDRRLPTQIKTDVLYLKNGQVVRGRFIDQVEGKVIFEQESGLQLNIPENQVEKIDRAL